MKYEKATTEVVRFEQKNFMAASQGTIDAINAFFAENYPGAVLNSNGQITGLGSDNYHKPEKGEVFQVEGYTFTWEPNGLGSGKWNCTSW